MILLYHLVFPDNTPKGAWNAGLVLRLAQFKRQITWLTRNFSVVSLDEYITEYLGSGSVPKKKIALTFDDGYKEVFDLVAPFLVEKKVPATFFANTSHLNDSELLWFVYFNALCSERCYPSVEINSLAYPLTSFRSSMLAWRLLIRLARQSGDPIKYSRDFAKKYPLPPHIISKYIGLGADQIRQIGASEFLAVGGHTTSHPYLDQISAEEQVVQIRSNKELLESLSGKPVKFFAYTSGVYNGQTIAIVKQLGFKAAFAISPRKISSEPIFEFPRVDIYSPSMLKFKLKLWGLVDLIRYLKIK